MTLSEKLNIVLITYNRKNFLEETIKTIISESSPIKNCAITILDNHSTDGTSEMVEEYCKKYPNLKHIVNRVNIGGNANAAKAYAEYITKEYIWTLCDNDKYSWENFSEIELAVESGYDVIFTQNCKDDISDMFYKATFTPACIYKTKNITPTVVENMYDNIRYLFPQLALFAYNMNKNNKIFIPKKDSIIQVINPEDNRTTFNRGLETDFVPRPRRDILWLVGYINSVELISDKKIQSKIIEGCRHYHKSLYELFKTFMIQNKYDRNNYGYNFSQVFRMLNFSQRLRFIWAYLKVNLSLKNYKYYEIRTYDDWMEYLDVINEQKYLNILSKLLKDKKILLYGAGIVSKVLTDKYDLSGLNIIGIADKRFESFNEESFKGYKAIKPCELKNYEFDYILFTMKLYKKIETSLKQQGVKQKTLSLIKSDRKYALRTG